jgi:hypothetical protein
MNNKSWIFWVFNGAVGHYGLEMGEAGSMKCYAVFEVEVACV